MIGKRKKLHKTKRESHLNADLGQKEAGIEKRKPNWKR